MAQTVAEFILEVVKERVGRVSGVIFKVVQELICQVSVLSEHVIEVSKAFLARLTLIVNLLMHLVALVVNIRDNLFFISYSSLLFLDQTVLDSLKLCSDGVEVVIMVFSPVYSFCFNQFFKVIPVNNSQLQTINLHSLMVTLPSFTEDVAFFSELSVKIIREILKSVLEFFLEGI